MFYILLRDTDNSSNSHFCLHFGESAFFWRPERLSFSILITANKTLRFLISSVNGIRYTLYKLFNKNCIVLIQLPFIKKTSACYINRINLVLYFTSSFQHRKDIII